MNNTVAPEPQQHNLGAFVVTPELMASLPQGLELRLGLELRVAALTDRHQGGDDKVKEAATLKIEAQHRVGSDEEKEHVDEKTRVKTKEKLHKRNLTGDSVLSGFSLGELSLSEFDLKQSYQHAVQCLIGADELIIDLQKQLTAKEKELAAKDYQLVAKDDKITALEEQLVHMSLELASSKAKEDEQRLQNRKLSLRSSVSTSGSDGSLHQLMPTEAPPLGSGSSPGNGAFGRSPWLSKMKLHEEAAINFKSNTDELCDPPRSSSLRSSWGLDLMADDDSSSSLNFQDCINGSSMEKNVSTGDVGDDIGDILISWDAADAAAHKSNNRVRNNHHRRQCSLPATMNATNNHRQPSRKTLPPAGGTAPTRRPPGNHKRQCSWTNSLGSIFHENIKKDDGSSLDNSNKEVPECQNRRREPVKHKRQPSWTTSLRSIFSEDDSADVAAGNYIHDHFRNIPKTLSPEGQEDTEDKFP